MNQKITSPKYALLQKKYNKMVWPFLGKAMAWHFFPSIISSSPKNPPKFPFFFFFFLLHLPEAWKLSIALGKLMEKSKGYSTDKTNIWPRDIKWLFCWISFCISLFLSRPNNFVLFISLRTKVSGLERIKYFCLKSVHNVNFYVCCKKIRDIYDYWSTELERHLPVLKTDPLFSHQTLMRGFVWLYSPVV